jgi:hypothetical protein
MDKVRSLEEANFTICVYLSSVPTDYFETILRYNAELNLILAVSSLRSPEETRTIVPSAKRMVLETLFMMHGKSLIYTLNSNGP